MKPEGLQQAHGALLVQGGRVSLWNTELDHELVHEFSRASAPCANLTGAHLYGGYFSNAYLTGANLSGANLEYASLTSGRMGGADLSDARIERAFVSP